MADTSAAVYLVTYVGSDVVTLGKCGLFQSGTAAYVGETEATLAKSMKDFTVSAPMGGPPAVAKVGAKEATRAEDEARAAARPAPAPEPKKAEEKKAEHKKEDHKKEEAKKADEKPAEKKPEPAPAAAAS